MRYLFALFLILASSFVALAQADGDARQAVFGKAGDGKIRVEAQGDFRLKGVYFVPKGMGLKYFYGICGGNGAEGDFGGAQPRRFIIHRTVEGESKKFSVDARRLAQADTEDFKLLDGDVIFAAAPIF